MRYAMYAIRGRVTGAYSTAGTAAIIAVRLMINLIDGVGAVKRPSNSPKALAGAPSVA